MSKYRVTKKDMTEFVLIKRIEDLEDQMTGLMNYFNILHEQLKPLIDKHYELKK